MTNRSILSQDLLIQPSQLFVGDLTRMGNFYHKIVLLDVLTKAESHWILGFENVPILELVSKPEFDNAPAKSAGLFHNAIKFDSRTRLSRVVLNIIKKSIQSYEGTGDHLVSEAFYFHDPEGNGLELYFDRPREDWTWVNGEVAMDTIYIDPQDYILSNLNGELGKNIELGHVHLRVGNIPDARKFYLEQLGFDKTLDMGSALFVSVGGYHHHLAMNTWTSAGVSKRDPALGLAEVKLILPEKSDLVNLANRLENEKVGFKYKSEELRVADPWDNKLLFTVE